MEFCIQCEQELKRKTKTKIYGYHKKCLDHMLRYRKRKEKETRKYEHQQKFGMKRKLTEYEMKRKLTEYENGKERSKKQDIVLILSKNFIINILTKIIFLIYLNYNSMNQINVVYC